MQGYEAIIITDADLSEEEQNAALDKIRSTIKTHDGTIKEYHLWGRRRLAYQINKKTHGIYHVFYIQGSQEMLTALNQQYRHNDEFIRAQTIKVENIEEEFATFLELIKAPSEEQDDDKAKKDDAVAVKAKNDTVDVTDTIEEEVQDEA